MDEWIATSEQKGKPSIGNSWQTSIDEMDILGNGTPVSRLRNILPSSVIPPHT